MTVAQLDADELEALMAAIDDGRRTVVSAHPSAPLGEGKAGPVVPYDLTGCAWLVHRRLPVLEAIDERLAERLSAALTLRLGMEVRVRAAPSTVLRFGELEQVCASSPAYGRIKLDGGAALLLVEPDTAKLLVAAALGQRQTTLNQGERGGVNDTITVLECSALLALMRSFVQAMAVAWAEVVDWRPALERFEIDPRLCQIAEPGEPGLLFEYQLLGGLRGKLRLMLPVATISPYKDRLQGSVRVEQAWEMRFASVLAQAVRRVPLELSAELGRARLTLGRFSELKPGDVLVLEQRVAAPVSVYLAGRKQFLAWPDNVGGESDGAKKDVRSIRIERVVEPLDWMGEPRARADSIQK